jgi:hypothetical protein
LADNGHVDDFVPVHERGQVREAVTATATNTSTSQVLIVLS